MRKQMLKIGAILAQTPKGGIGMKGKLPWENEGIRLSQDMMLFRTLTKTTPKCRRAVAMGYNTWMSLPISQLPGRTNYVISKQHKTPLLTFESIHDCISHASSTNHNELWFIGGAQIYEYIFRWNIADEIWRTTVSREFLCDTFVPEIPLEYQRVYRFINKNSPIKFNKDISQLDVDFIKKTIPIEIEQFVRSNTQTPHNIGQVEPIKVLGENV